DHHRDPPPDLLDDPLAVAAEAAAGAVRPPLPGAGSRRRGAPAAGPGAQSDPAADQRRRRPGQVVLPPEEGLRGLARRRRAIRESGPGDHPALAQLMDEIATLLHERERQGLRWFLIALMAAAAVWTVVGTLFITAPFARL